MKDILFRTEDSVFSYRTAGILRRDDRILLQKPEDDDGFAVPGGHAALGETNAMTLIREFREECGAVIEPGPLRAVAEIFFPWGERQCHQICTYYEVRLSDPDSLPHTESFLSSEKTEQGRAPIRFWWIPAEKLDEICIYPPQILPVLRDPSLTVQHILYREEQA